MLRARGPVRMSPQLGERWKGDYECGVQIGPISLSPTTLSFSPSIPLSHHASLHLCLFIPYLPASFFHSIFFSPYFLSFSRHALCLSLYPPSSLHGNGTRSSDGNTVTFVILVRFENVQCPKVEIRLLKPTHSSFHSLPAEINGGK